MSRSKGGPSPGGAAPRDSTSEAGGAPGSKPLPDPAELSRRFAEGATTQSTATQVGRSADAVYKALAKIRQALFDCVTRTLAAAERLP